MSVFLWRVLCIVAASLFVIVLITLLVTNLTKNKYYKNFHEDELIKKEKSVNSVNSIYLTSGETKKFIKKYVICKTVYEKYLVCNFAEKFSFIKYFVVQFSRRKRVISVVEVAERDVDSDSSKIIALKRTCKYVNVVIGTANSAIINQNYIRPISMYRLRLYAFLKSVAIFSILFVLRHCIIEIFCKNTYLYQYLNTYLDYIAIGASFLLSVFSYLITMLSFRRRNAKARNGGALEYEFV